MLYFDKEYSFSVTIGFAEPAYKPSDLFDSEF